MITREVRRFPVDMTGRLSEMLEPRPIEVGTVFAARPDLMWSVSDDGPNARLIAGPLTLDVPHEMRRALEFCLTQNRFTAELLPAPYISAFMDGCLDSERDVTRGGARYDLTGVSMVNSVANLVDSLLVIRKLVFEERRLTVRQLLEAADRDFVGHEEVLDAVRGVEGKWGNGEAEADGLARRVMELLCAETHERSSWKGAPFVVYVISMITHTIDGRLSITSPDGRRAGTPYAASCNPYNVERHGPTGANPGFAPSTP